MERHPITFLPTGRRKVADGCPGPLRRTQRRVQQSTTRRCYVLTKQL